MDLPHVVAVVVCGASDPSKAPNHVEAFLFQCLRSLEQQSYPAEKLTILLVSEARNAELLKPFCQSPRVVGCSPNNPEPTLGELRNAALDFAAAEHPQGFCIQCDSDDWHGVDRIRLQVAAAMSEPGLPSFLRRQICYSWESDVAFLRTLRLYGKGKPPEGEPTPICGTICHPVTELRYPALDQGEDTAFRQLFSGYVELDDNDPRLYVRFSHGTSTSGHNHVMQDAANYRRGTWAIPMPCVEFLQTVISGYPASLRIPTRQAASAR